MVCEAPGQHETPWFFGTSGLREMTKSRLGQTQAAALHQTAKEMAEEMAIQGFAVPGCLQESQTIRTGSSVSEKMGLLLPSTRRASTRRYLTCKR